MVGSPRRSDIARHRPQDHFERLPLGDGVELQRDRNGADALEVQDFGAPDLRPLRENLSYRHVARDQRHASVAELQLHLGPDRPRHERDGKGDEEDSCQTHGLIPFPVTHYSIRPVTPFLQPAYRFWK